MHSFAAFIPFAPFETFKQRTAPIAESGRWYVFVYYVLIPKRTLSYGE